MKDKEFNGYSFDDEKMRREMKYLVITGGDLDLNGAYAFRTKRALKSYLKEQKSFSWKGIQAVFQIKDITKLAPNL